MTSATDQTFETIPMEALLEKAGELRKQGYRLVQIGTTRLPEHVELTYSFDLESRLTNLRFQVPADGARVPSISSVFCCAFLYENEMHDLFNVQVDGMAVDFHGHLYETAVKFPFGKTKMPAPKPAPAAAAPSPAPSTGAAPPATAKRAQLAGATGSDQPGVRPSSGAATSVSSRGSKPTSASDTPEAAAPGDGRTPMAHKS